MAKIDNYYSLNSEYMTKSYSLAGNDEYKKAIAAHQGFLGRMLADLLEKLVIEPERLAAIKKSNEALMYAADIKLRK